MSEQDAESDTNTDDTSTEDEEESEATEIHQVHNVLNETTYHEEDLSEDENSLIETDPHSDNGSRLVKQKTNSLLLLPTLKLKLKVRS